MSLFSLIDQNWNLLGGVATVLAGFVLWHLSQRFVSRKDFDAAITELTATRVRQDETLDALSANIVELNSTIRNMPSLVALHRLELGLEEVRGLQRESAAQLKGYGAAMERLQNTMDRLTLEDR